jgi:hypothetical protein
MHTNILQGTTISQSSTATEHPHSLSSRLTSIGLVLDSLKQLMQRMHPVPPTANSMPSQHSSLPAMKLCSAKRPLLLQQLPTICSPSWQTALLPALGQFRLWVALRSSMSTSPTLSNKPLWTASSLLQRSTQRPSRYVTFNLIKKSIIHD